MKQFQKETFWSKNHRVVVQVAPSRRGEHELDFSFVEDFSSEKGTAHAKFQPPETILHGAVGHHVHYRAPRPKLHELLHVFFIPKPSLRPTKSPCQILDKLEHWKVVSI
jgi:hypothetical protein